MTNYSRQRAEILDLLKTNYNHPTAEEIYLILKTNGSTSSRSTVYRNLGLLSQQDQIRKITVTDAPDRYDFIRYEHGHIVCSGCKKVFDFNYDFNHEEIKKSIQEQTKADISNNMTILCLCNSCQKASL